MNLFSLTRTNDTVAFIIVIALLALTGYIVPTKTAEAGGLGATEFTQWMNNAELVVNSTQNTISAANSTLQVAKEGADAFAWSIAKQMVTQMTQSMVEWINGGFQGSPAFVTDINGMLKSSLDSAAGQYIASLGDVGEFICSPFKLDITAALNINYQQAQSGMPSGPTACTLTGVENNIKNFLNGAPADMSQWLQITSNPQNTPYGAYLEAETKLNARLVNEAGNQITLANWGQGFLSKKVCEGPNGAPADTGVNCKVVTPGKVISDALTFQLSTGPQSLIQADEVNEVIGALINQLTLQAMQGVNGLLGLGGNDSYTDYSYGNGNNTNSYIDTATIEELALSANTLLQQVGSSTSIETSYLTAANSTLTTAQAELNIISTGQVAMTNLLNSSTATAIGITANSTYNDALAKLNIALANGSQPQALLANVQTELTAIYNSLTIIAAINPQVTQSTNLTQVPFSTLQTEGQTVQTSLTGLVNQITPIIPQITNTLQALAQITAEINLITSQTGTAANDALQKATTDYLVLVQSGAIITEAGLAAKQASWQAILGTNTATIITDPPQRPIAVPLKPPPPNPLSATLPLFPEWQFVSTASAVTSAGLTEVKYNPPTSASCHNQYQKIMASVSSKTDEQLYFAGGSSNSCKLSETTPDVVTNVEVGVVGQTVVEAVQNGTEFDIHTHPSKSIAGMNGTRTGFFADFVPSYVPNLALTGKSPSSPDFTGRCVMDTLKNAADALFADTRSFVADPLGMWQYQVDNSSCDGADPYSDLFDNALLYEACELSASTEDNVPFANQKDWINKWLVEQGVSATSSTALKDLQEAYTNASDCMIGTQEMGNFNAHRVTEDEFCNVVCPATST